MEGGQEALHSMIAQFMNQIKDLKSQNKHLSDTVKQLQFQQSQGNPSGKASALENGIDKNCGTELEAKSLDASNQSKVSLGSKSEQQINGGNAREGDLPMDVGTSSCDDQFGEEAERLLGEIVKIYEQQLKEKDVLESRARGQELYNKHSKATGRHALEFLHVLKELTSHVEGYSESSSTDLPVWIRMVLAEGDVGELMSVVRPLWKLLQWSLYHVSEGKKIDPSVSEDDIDLWYTKYTPDLYSNLKCPRTRLRELHAAMCSDFDVLKPESDGLATSILMPEEYFQPDQHEDGPAGSSEVSGKELFRFKSMLLDMAKAVGDFIASGQERRRKESVERQESELYLPQKESLETYDLGNMLMTTNRVIESLSNKVMTLESERGLCKNCRRHVEDGPSMEAPEDANYQMFKKAFFPANRFLSGSPVSPPQALSSGLRSGESASNVSSGASGGKSAFQPVRQTVPTRAEQPQLPTRTRQQLPPRQMLMGYRGALPPRQLTILQNSNTPVRSKSYSGPEGTHLRKKELISQEASAKSSSWESVFPAAAELAKKKRAVPHKGSQGDWRGGVNASFSDSDEDYEVRGPPDTPPEVRAMDFQRRRSHLNEASEQFRYRGGNMMRPSDFGDPAETKLNEPYHPYKNEVSSEDVQRKHHVPHFMHSQVQQCTGDNVNSQQDMLLPSSVEWSTIQLKDGGIPSPTLETVRGSSAMRLAEQSVRDQRCAICKCQFKSTLSRADIHAHILKHMRRESPDGSDTEDFPRGDAQAAAVTGSGGSPGTASRDGLLKECPVCNIKFPAYVPVQARQSHINLHFEENRGGIESFEIIDDTYGSPNK